VVAHIGWVSNARVKIFFSLRKSAANSYFRFFGETSTSCGSPVNFHANVATIVTTDRETTIPRPEIHHASKLRSMLPDYLPVEVNNVRRGRNL
jgi:hypothetical protein